MEMIQALQEARNLGVTKEEFIRLWELEAKTNQMKEEAKLLSARQPQETESTARIFHYLVTQVESLTNSLNLQMQGLRNQINELDQTIQFTRGSLEVIKEEQRKLFQHGSTLKDEVSQQFKTFSSNIYKIESLIETLNQKLETWVKIQPAGTETSQVSPGTSYEVIDGAHFEMASYKHLPSTNGSHFAWGSNQKEKEASGKCEEIDPVGKTGEENWSLVSVGRKSGKHKTFAEDGASGNSRDLASVTGPIADAISHMMSEKNSNIELLSGRSKVKTNGSCLSENGGTDVHHGRVKDARVLPSGPSITYIPGTGAEFFISISKTLKVLDTFTEFFYTRPKACRVRIRLWFNKRGRLGIHVLVSEGVFDDRHKWPIVFEGSGEIFNQGSQAYTKLWMVESQECPMPANMKEETLGASVCLSTSRDPTEDVTLDLLTRKRYVADGDRLLFRWHLTAVEKGMANSRNGFRPY